MGRIVAIAILCALMITPAVSQSDRDSARSVVQIRCSFADGPPMKATGFIWPDPGFVVTALHAVAGCANGTAYSQEARDSTKFAELVSVVLEADLALIRLEEDLGLPAVSLARNPADTRAAHKVWGYPLVAEKIRGDEVRFADTLDGNPIKLGRAYSSPDLAKLFRSQDYPTRNTMIHQVSSLLQPGHSGAPIFDRSGQVIAIADGGLLGGWLGMNWSIPAHIYLPQLLNSGDEIPLEVSRWAELFSAALIDEPRKTVMLSGTDGSGLGENGHAWQKIGVMPLHEIEADYALSGSEKYARQFQLIHRVFGSGQGYKALGYDIFRHRETGGLLAIPNVGEFTRNFDGDHVGVTGLEGRITLTGLARIDASFGDAYTTTMYPFLESAFEQAGLEDEFDEDDIEYDGDLEYAVFGENFREDIEGDIEIGLDIEAYANGDIFFGFSLQGYEADLFTDREFALYEIFWLGFEELNGLSGLNEHQKDWLIPYRAPAKLSLVRRVFLQDLAEEFVADKNFDWKDSVYKIKSRLKGSDRFQDLSFDIYEDADTGATVAVPTGMELRWNRDISTLQAVSDSGNARLNIALVKARSFEDATGRVLETFVNNISAFASWKGTGSPKDCTHQRVNPRTGTAKCNLYLVADVPIENYSDLFLNVSVKGKVFLGSAVFVEGREDGFTDEQAIQYRMMIIAAEHLSAFAVH